MGEYGFLCTGNEKHLGAKAGLADLEAIQCFFREIFIWQLLRLVLTYNFTDCDFEKIKMEYREVILIDLNSYMIGAQSTKGNDCLFCDDQWHTPHTRGGAVPQRTAPLLSSRLGPESWAERAAPDCLTKIEHLTFHPTHGCQSLAEEIFAIKTKATLTHRCPGYSGIQINNNTLAMKKGKEREDVKNECQKIVSKLIGLWRRFTRFNRNKNLH
nr:PREDICTED: thymic stromal lymphopoietin [Rhinolophus sinicus]